MRMGVVRPWSAALAAILLMGVGSVALAQSSAVGKRNLKSDPSAQAAAQTAQEALFPSAYGTTQYTIYQIPAAAFTPRGGAATYQSDSGVGTIWLTGTSNGDDIMWAPVFLPTGALLSYVDTYGCDNNGGGNHLETFFSGYTGFDSPSYALTDFTFLQTTSDTTTPCRYFISTLTHTINNNVRYAGGYHYAVNVRFLALDGTNQLKGVDIWWQRQVSPSPGVATFSDVPLADGRNKFVEALAASGITAGCGGGKFCPDLAVTRGQVAVFLAAALGLNFPF